jgi:excinuclease UvrABC nuclease subunit
MACPGVYMFCRQYGESVIPLYIGRSKNLYNRIWEHFETTTFMKAKTLTHAVTFSGFRGATRFSGGKMYVKKAG